jgi:O-antigen/teichoic acid export membrane protein
MRRDLVGLGRNFILSLGGEGVQSGFHFALNLILIRVLSAYDFGVFAIAFVLGGIALSYGNALVSVPAAVHMPRLKSPGAVNYQDVVFGSVALVFSAVIGALIAAGLLLTINHTTESIAGGFFVGLWTLRNHVRTAMFARRMMAGATLSDVSYTVSGILFVAVALWLDRDGERVTSTLVALAAANFVATGIALRALGLRIRVSFRRGIWRRYRGIWSDIAWSLFGTTTWNVQSQALTFLVAAIAGPAAYAPVAAGMVLFTPLRPAVNAFINVFRADFVAALAEGRYRRLNVTLYSASAMIVIACIAAGAGIWLIWPFLDAHIFAGKFDHSSLPLIVVFSGLSAVVYLTYNVPLALIQAAGHFKPVAIATTCGGIVGLCTVSVLLGVTSVAWSLAGVVAGEAVCGVYLWIAARRILQRHTAPAWRPAAPAAVNVAEVRA